jgi:AcrR family transcriptional regulator
MPTGAKPAVQVRSRDTRDRLLSALDDLLREKDFEAVTIAEIAARAGVSPATIYQRFNNRDAAIAILIELYMRRVADWSRSPEGAVDYPKATSLEQAFEQVAMAAWRQFEALGYLTRPAYLYSRLRPNLVGEQWDLMQAQAVKGFEALLSAFAHELPDGVPARAAPAIAYFFNMMFLGRLLHDDPSGAPRMTPQRFARELADFACGYLARQGPAERRSR